MIHTCVKSKEKEYDTVYEALGLSKNQPIVLSVVGGGGKTTILRRLQREYELEGVPSIVTTTTHIQRLNAPWFLEEPSIEKLKLILKYYGKVWMGSCDGQTRASTFSEDFLEEVCRLRHPLLIEADGAKMYPCKAPEQHEPVILSGTDMVLSVFGLDALYKRIKDVCFRPERVAALLGKEMEDYLLPEDMEILASHNQGGKKNVASYMDYQIVLNKADTEELKEIGCRMAKHLCEAGISRVHVTSRLMEKEWPERKRKL